MFLCVVKIKSGAEFEGILHGPVLGTKQLHITLKNVRLVKNPRNELNKTLIEKEYYTLIIPSLDFVQMRILDIPNYFHSSKDIDTNGSKKQISHRYYYYYYYFHLNFNYLILIIQWQ